ncbi:hypothetical protein ASJ82_07250 [Methanosphaera cuniculi]|uniref:Uncharacterized protein n=2 Tax=Methanosphaera cuniculi TaxID=1077256 RepID=A0A2A2HC17_9EURY|nr:hypothetical protein ASJ82_07250 [Methanosphaera cuniculi]PWL08669.1 hypothetical protein MSCUN_03820 [Methanosphaera cuniculi]
MNTTKNILVILIFFDIIFLIIFNFYLFLMTTLIIILLFIYEFIMKPEVEYDDKYYEDEYNMNNPNLPDIRLFYRDNMNFPFSHCIICGYRDECDPWYYCLFFNCQPHTSDYKYNDLYYDYIDYLNEYGEDVLDEWYYE